MDYEDIDVMTPKILYNAVRQYRHNKDDGFIGGYDREETNKAVEKLESEIHDMQLELNRAQSELQHYKQLLKDQRDFASISDGAATEAIDELNEANAAIRHLHEGLQKCWPLHHNFMPAIDRALKERE